MPREKASQEKRSVTVRPKGRGHVSRVKSAKGKGVSRGAKRTLLVHQTATKNATGSAKARSVIWVLRGVKIIMYIVRQDGYVKEVKILASLR